jgi:2'-5' RNA ligase
VNGITSLLDEKHYKLTQQIWADLDYHLGLRGIYITPFPHFTYKVAQKFDLAELEPVLAQIATEQKPFRVRTGGIGIFPGEKPVVYIPVVRDAYLSNFHRELWQKLSGIGENAEFYYEPPHWMPHISLAFGDVTTDNLPDVIAYVNELDLYWELEVNNLAVIYDDGEKQTVKLHFEFNQSV